MLHKKLTRIIIMVLLLCIPLTTTFAGGNQEADDDIYEIVWHHIGADIPEGDKEQFLNEVNAYLEEKIGVRVNYDPYDWGDYTERMTLIANSGEAWDLAFTASWAFNYQDNARRGNFLAVNDLLDEYGQGILKDMAPQFIEGNKIDEKLYAVATNKEVGTWPILTIPTAMVEKYNIDTSLEYWTYENLEPAYAQFKRDFPNDYPLWPEGINSAQMAWEHIGPIFNPDIPIVQYISGSDFQIYNQFEIPEQIEHLKMLRKFLDAGYIHPDIPALEAEQQRVINILQEGKFIAKYDLAFPGAEPALENRYRQPVVFKGMTAPVSENSSISGSMLAISVNSERPDKVMQFLNLLNSDPYVRNAFNWGIEGVHYDKIADNRIRINPDNSWTLPQFSLQNFFILWLTENQPEDLWVKFREFNNSARSLPALGFIPDLEPIKGEYAAVVNVAGEYKNFLYRQGSLESNIAEYNAKLKANGMDKILAELNRQFDVWMAAK